MSFHLPTALAVAAGILALALAGGGAGPVAVGVATALVWLLLAGFGFGGRLTLSGLTPPLAAALGALALLAAWQAVSFSWASDDGAAFAELTLSLLYLGILALVGLTARPGSAPSWFAGIALGGAAVAIVAVGSRTLGFEADAGLAAELPRAAERLSYPLGYWNALGYLMAMTMPALAWVAASGRSGLARIAVAGSVPVVLALFLTSSRGAALAAVVAVLLVGWFSADRARVLLAGLVAAPAWIAVVALAAVRRDELEAGAGTGDWGFVVAAAVLVAAAAAHLAFGRLAGRRGTPRAELPRLGRLPVAALGLALIALVAAVGPSSFVGEFRTDERASEDATGALVSGSGRSSFWGAAIDAFGEDPLRGVGAGGYPLYWNANGGLRVPVSNAHSAPLENFAELGLVGGAALLALLAMPLLAARRLLREAIGLRRAQIGTALAILAAGLVAIGIDWTWQTPAAVAPLLTATALLAGQALRRPGSTGSLLVDPRIAGYEPRDAPPRVPRAPIGLAVAALALVSIWAGAVLALASIQLERSAERLAEGDPQGAAEAARAAAELEPWSPEPSLRLAEIEQAANNLRAARLRAREAVRLSPLDFRPWLLLTDIEIGLGNEAALNYAARATTLGRQVISARDIREGLR